MDNQHTHTRPRQRRNVERKLPDSTVPSPCIGVCWLNDDTQFCDGCLRSAEEIRDWIIMDKTEKLAVLELVEQRQIESSNS